MNTLPAERPKKGLVERATLVTLVGLSVLSVLAVAAVTVYLNRIGDSADRLTRAQIMPDYAGRPAAVLGESGSPVQNYLIMVEADHTLQAVVIANLSASRRNLTMIAVAADLTSTDPEGHTLATGYALDPAITVRSMEGLTTSRMDHQIVVNIDQCAPAIDSVGGITVNGNAMDGAQTSALLSATRGSQKAAVASAEVIRSFLISMSSYNTLINPGQLNHVIKALAPCVRIDSGLTTDSIQTTLMESSVHPAETRIWPLATHAAMGGSAADQSSLAALQSALSSPDMPETNHYQQQAFLPQEQPR